MRIDREVHAFRRESQQAAPIIDGSETLEGDAHESEITGLVLVERAFHQASQTRMRETLIAPLVLAPEVLEMWPAASDLRTAPAGEPRCWWSGRGSDASQMAEPRQPRRGCRRSWGRNRCSWARSGGT